MASRDWKWTLDDDASDLSGPTPKLFDKRLLAYPEASGSLVLTIPFGTSTTGWWWSPANQPGNHDWRVGPWAVKFDVLVANARIVAYPIVGRVDGFGSFVQAYAFGEDVSLGTAGPKSWAGTTLAQTAAPLPDSSHRLRLGIVFTRDNGIGSEAVTIGFGDPDGEFIEVPIVMGNPAIMWNGNTLAFPGPLTGYDADIDADGEIAFSAGRVASGLLHSLGDTVRIETGNFDDAQFEADLRAWWSWAAQKKQYAFALDSADVVNLALNGAAAAGQKDIPLADTSSVVVGRRYLLREVAGSEEEIIQVASITANVKAVAVSNLKYGYLTADKFRAIDYFPKMVSLDEKKPWRQHFTTWSLEHLMTEDRG